MCNSRTCFCASAIVTAIGLILVILAFAVVTNVTYNKLRETTPPPSASAQQPRPAPPPPPYPPPQNGGTTAKPDAVKTLNTYLLSTETADWWVVVMALLALGIGISCLGFWCSNCIMCCCTGSGASSRPSSVRPADNTKDWPSDA